MKNRCQAFAFSQIHNLCRYAGEARRLLQVPTSAQGAAEALAADFDALGKRLIG
jgi:hypothetical protein